MFKSIQHTAIKCSLWRGRCCAAMLLPVDPRVGEHHQQRRCPLSHRQKNKRATFWYALLISDVCGCRRRLTRHSIKIETAKRTTVWRDVIDANDPTHWQMLPMLWVRRRRGAPEQKHSPSVHERKIICVYWRAGGESVNFLARWIWTAAEFIA